MLLWLVMSVSGTVFTVFCLVLTPVVLCARRITHVLPWNSGAGIMSDGT